MEYITTRRLRELAADGKPVNIPYGTTFETIGDFIATAEGRAICYDTSELAHKYFARNDDGRGLERGKLTYAIAYGKRVKLNENGYYFRLSDEERAMLRRDWAHFLLDNEDVVLFNHDFFNAEVEELQELAKALNIKV